MFLSRWLSRTRAESDDPARVLERLRRLRVRPVRPREDGTDPTTDRLEDLVTRLRDLPGEPPDPPESATVVVESDDLVRGSGSDPPDADESMTVPFLGLRVDRSRLRRGHVVIVAVLLLLAVVGAGVLLLRNRPVEEPVGSAPARATVLQTAAPSAPVTGAPDPTAAGTETPAELLVHVAGKVRDPGVVRLWPGARVADAVKASGGMLPGVDPATINLAQPVADGQQVLVGVRPPAGQPSPSGPPATGGTGGTGGIGGTSGPAAPLDLNVATLEQLDELPGIGPVLAERILLARDQRGGFTAVDELMEVSGIGEKTYAELQPLVTVG